MAENLGDGGSIWSLIFTDNWIALLILLVLMVMSAMSWAVMIVKWVQFKRVRAENNHFYHYFQGSQKFEFSPLARMFAASFDEITAFRKSMEEKQGTPIEVRERLMLALARRLESVYNHQNENLEGRLPLLATVASASPYIGLFGTVLGIIDAFRSIATMGVTSLAVVAPGISEALVATAAGLMAAIPALIAYNMFRNRVREFNMQMKNFALEVTNRLERLM
jgi:biopolymer transport protein TolQ